ncbi:MAG: hypothetical protein WC321_06945 [Candidatus Omnitrophota bacterium]
MKKRKIFRKYIPIGLILLAMLLFVAKFSGPAILRLYVESGIGNCREIPIFCMVPAPKIITPEIDAEYAAGLLSYEFPKMEISLPRGFNVVQEKIKKVYYKKTKRLNSDSVVYLLHKGPGFFINLFPQLKKQGVKDNYQFVRRTMHSDIRQIKDLTGAFFAIIKGIFIPDIGDQKNARMVEFNVAGRRGFINYSFTRTGNYFDCNVIDEQDNFFKVYVKDKGAALDLEKAFTIISTIKNRTAPEN